MAIDLDAYFRRIGYGGARAPTIEVLRDLHVRHPAAIAFENLNPLLGWPVRLDASSLEQKMVRGGRGGYCYEHNSLFRYVLEALGFPVTGLGARVLWNVPEHTVAPRTHMLLLIDLDGRRYIADVGFGGQTLTGPLRLETDVEQATPHEPFRIVRLNGDLAVQTKVRDAWNTLYRFDLSAQLPPDYEVSNWYVATHPESPFVGRLAAARAAPESRYALRNNELAVHRRGGDTERRVLTSVAQLRATLEEVFKLTLPDTPALDTCLARFI